MDGVTRPLIDWLCTRERAIAHAQELAEELRDKVPCRIVIERGDGSVEQWLAA